MSHRGRPIYMIVNGDVVVLCPLKHVLEFIPAKEWAGSKAEARAADETHAVECDGSEARP